MFFVSRGYFFRVLKGITMFCALCIFYNTTWQRTHVYIYLRTQFWENGKMPTTFEIRKKETTLRGKEHTSQCSQFRTKQTGSDVFISIGRSNISNCARCMKHPVQTIFKPRGHRPIESLNPGFEYCLWESVGQLSCPEGERWQIPFFFLSLPRRVVAFWRVAKKLQSTEYRYSCEEQHWRRSW